MVTIELVTKEDEQDLFDFEFNNRLYFEKMVPGRGDEYYIQGIFKEKLQKLIEEQREGLSYFYLIKDQRSSIIGRMNLVDVDKEKKMGYLGYRVGEDNTGKGIATIALELLLKEAIIKNITEIHAKTTTNNIGSQRVLEKMNFKRVGVEKEVVFLNGEKHHFIHYIWKSI